MNDENKYTISNIAKNIVDFIKYIPTIPYTNANIPEPDIQIHKFYANESIIKGFIWLDKTPSIKKNNCGIPIPEHRDLYKKCKKEGIDFYWTTKSF